MNKQPLGGCHKLLTEPMTPESLSDSSGVYPLRVATHRPDKADFNQLLLRGGGTRQNQYLYKLQDYLPPSIGAEYYAEVYQKELDYWHSGIKKGLKPTTDKLRQALAGYLVDTANGQTVEELSKSINQPRHYLVPSCEIAIMDNCVLNQPEDFEEPVFEDISRTIVIPSSLVIDNLGDDHQQVSETIDRLWQTDLAPCAVQSIFKSGCISSKADLLNGNQILLKNGLMSTVGELSDNNEFITNMPDQIGQQLNQALAAHLAQDLLAQPISLQVFDTSLVLEVFNQLIPDFIKRLAVCAVTDVKTVNLESLLGEIDQFLSAEADLSYKRRLPHGGFAASILSDYDQSNLEYALKAEYRPVVRQAKEQLRAKTQALVAS